MKNIIYSLSSINEWSLFLIKFRNVNEEFSCNTCPITIETKDSLRNYLFEFSLKYNCMNNKPFAFQRIIKYDGTIDDTSIHYIDLDDDLIVDSYKKWLFAFKRPDQNEDPILFSPNGYALKGHILEPNGAKSSIIIFTICSPIRLYKHSFLWTKDTFHEVSEKVLSLITRIDVIIYKNSAYFFNMNGEKLFDMERAYRINSNKKIDAIIETKMLSDNAQFKQYASFGYNPRRFISFNEDRFNKLANDKVFRNTVAVKFNLELNNSGKFVSSSSDGVDKIVKFLCGKGMIDPVDDSPVEVESSRRWES